MRTLKVSLLVFGFCLFAMPLYLPAQDGGKVDPPIPPCCPRSPGMLGQVGPMTLQAQFSVSTGLLEAQGISRRQFADRLSAAFFAGTAVDVLVFTKTTVSQNSPDNPNAPLGKQNLDAGGQGLIAIEETRTYRIPFYGLNAADFEAMDQIGLTDGTIQVTIKFVKGSSLSSNTQ